MLLCCVCVWFAYFFPEYLYQKDRKKRLNWKKVVSFSKTKKKLENKNLLSKFLHYFLLSKAWCCILYIHPILKSRVENSSLSLEVHCSICHSMIFHLLNKASVTLLGPFQYQPHSLYDVDISSSNLENVLYQKCCVPLGSTIFYCVL